MRNFGGASPGQGAADCDAGEDRQLYSSGQVGNCIETVKSGIWHIGEAWLITTELGLARDRSHGHECDRYSNCHERAHGPRHPSLWKALMTSKSCGGCLKDLRLKLDAHTRLEAV